MKKLQRSEKNKKRKEKEKNQYQSIIHHDQAAKNFRRRPIGFEQEQKKIDSSSEEYGYEDTTYEEYSSKEKYKEKDVSGGGEMGLKVLEGQKLSQKQFQMLETAAEERKTSTHPGALQEQSSPLNVVSKLLKNYCFK